MSYIPTIPPADPAAIPHYLTTELQALAQSLQQSQPYAYLQTLNVAPAKPREGLIAKADGTHWNPGSGAGVYCYIAGAWVFFGGGGGTGTVTHTSGALTAHAVIVGNGTADVKALAALGASGTVLTSNGAGADPSFQPGGGTGTVTSVGVGSTGSTLTVTGSPVTGSGTINADLNLGHRNEWTASQNVGQVALTDASTITPNGALSNNFYLLTTTGVGSSRIMAVPTSLNAGDIVNFEVKQPSSGGPCVIAWAAGYLWGQGGSAPPPIASQTASASEFYSFTVQNNGNLHGVMIGQSGPAGPGYKATSTTSQSTGTGSKTFAVQAGLAWLPGGRVRFTSVSTGEFMEGVITAYAIASMTVLIDLNNCTGAHTDWDVNATGQAGATGPTGNTGSTGPAGASSSAGPSGTAGRLTLTTGVPVTTSDVIGATTIYWTPYKGNQVQLWDGSNWTTYTSAEIPFALGTLTAAIGYDVFLRQVSAVPTLDLLAWTNATTRATAVTYQDGRLCKSGDKTRLYLGSFYTTSTTTTEDSTVRRFLYNNYNQESRDMSKGETTASWTPPTANVFRQSNGSTSNKVECFSGQPQPLDAKALSIASGTTGQNAGSGIGIDSVTVNSAQLSGGGLFSTSATQYSSSCKLTLPVGYHAINWLEIVTNTTGQFFYGTGTLPFFNSGILVRVPA